MRFEAKHQYFKRIAAINRNFHNVALSHGRIRKRGKAPQAILPEDSSSSEAGSSRGRSSQGRGRGRGATTQTSLKHQESEEEEPRPSQIQHGRGRGRGRGGRGRSTSRTRATGRPRPGNLRNLEAISQLRRERKEKLKVCPVYFLYLVISPDHYGVIAYLILYMYVHIFIGGY